MKAAVYKSSCYDPDGEYDPPCAGAVHDPNVGEWGEWIIEVETIADLLKISSRPVIVSYAATDDKFDIEIEIYDDWRE